MRTHRLPRQPHFTTLGSQLVGQLSGHFGGSFVQTMRSVLHAPQPQ